MLRKKKDVTIISLFSFNHPCKFRIADFRYNSWGILRNLNSYTRFTYTPALLNSEPNSPVQNWSMSLCMLVGFSAALKFSINVSPQSCTNHTDTSPGQQFWRKPHAALKQLDNKHSVLKSKRMIMFPHGDEMAHNGTIKNNYSESNDKPYCHHYALTCWWIWPYLFTWRDASLIVLDFLLGHACMLKLSIMISIT